MPNYYRVQTNIDHGFTHQSIIAADTAQKAIEAMQQLAQPYGYTVQSEARQLNSTEAAEAEEQAIILDIKPPTHTAQPTRPIGPEEICADLNDLDNEKMTCFLRYLSFLHELDKQPHTTT